jgi:hypothetical protein
MREVFDGVGHVFEVLPAHILDAPEKVDLSLELYTIGWQ